jgi:hypothetical protein
LGGGFASPFDDPGIRSEPLAELDDDLKIKVLKIEATFTTRNRKDACSDLFGFLVERQFAKELPTTEEDCERLLENDLSQAAYDIARSRGWLPLVQVGRKVYYSEYILGDRARQLNALNQPDRLPTMEETRDSWWWQLIREWEARFLEMRKATVANSGSPTQPQSASGSRDLDAAPDGGASPGPETATLGQPKATPATEQGKCAARAATRQAIVTPILAKKRWTRGKWATDAGVGKNSVYEYFAGKRKLSTKNRQAMAEALGLKPGGLPD